VRRLKEELEDSNLDVQLLHPFNSSSITAGVSCSQNKFNLILNRISGIRFDDYDLNLQRKLEGPHSKSINNSNSLKAIRDKTDQLDLLHSLDAPIIPSLYFRGEIEREKLQNNLKKINATDEFIVKTQRGNQGLGVNLLRGNDSLIAFLETFWAMGDQRLIIQPLLRFKKEIRLFMINAEYIAGIEKTITNDGDFRANSKRVKGEVLNIKALNKTVSTISKKVMKDLDLFYAGLDFAITESGEVKLLEVNPCPGFEDLEKLTSKNIAKEIISKALSL
jgi:ribosomal protein S6--L-glutamate ligase